MLTGSFDDHTGGLEEAVLNSGETKLTGREQDNELRMLTSLLLSEPLTLKCSKFHPYFGMIEKQK
jgi:hypothetical protein